MTHSRISIKKTVAFLGVEPKTIDVQVQLLPGLPTFQIVGLPDKTVFESKERIRSSFYSMGLALPSKRIIVNLAPADLPKEGSHYDLPIALGILEYLGAISSDAISTFYSLGELGLDGKLARVQGVFPTAIEAAAHNMGLICPKSCENEAIWAGNEHILAFESFFDIMNHFKGITPISYSSHDRPKPYSYSGPNFDDVVGQFMSKRVLEIAAAGGHNVLMVGPPGAGKSMLAERFLSILPSLDPKEALETTTIHSLAGLLPEEGLITSKPFRSPHHSASIPALVGGGQKSRPGEISLAHNGVLFLDELAEFPRVVLDSLRQPLENGRITVSRVNHRITYPARFQLIAAMNPCRCGFFGMAQKQCHRAPKCAEDYQSRLSGPLLDRFDLCIYMKVPSLLSTYKKEEPSTPQDQQMLEKYTTSNIKKRVLHAQMIQKKRENKLNAHVDVEHLKKITLLTQESIDTIEKFERKFDISARGFHRLLRVARTIADLEEAHDIQTSHLIEAIQYRREGVLF